MRDIERLRPRTAQERVHRDDEYVRKNMQHAKSSPRKRTALAAADTGLPRQIGFANAAFKDEAGTSTPLRCIVAEPGGKRRPVRLRLFTGAASEPQLAGILELTKKEAYALSEWLDEIVTSPRE